MRLLLILTALFLAACSGEPQVRRPAPGEAAPATLQAYVVSHGWHTGLVVPGVVLNRLLPGLQARFGRPAFYELGWGDKGFYQAPKITAGLALRAMFWSPGTVLHVVAVPESPQQSFPNSEVRAICLTPAGLESLAQFLRDSFVHDGSGQIVALAPGIYGDSQFYDARGRYWFLNTCNKWTAKGLASAGFDIRPGLKLTAGSVMHYLEDEPAGPCAAGAISGR